MQTPNPLVARRCNALLMVFAWLALWPAPCRAADTVDFEQEVAPLIARRCLECHGANEASGGLNLSTHATVLSGGDSGPALVASDAMASHILARVVAGEMPPEKNGKPQQLPEEEIAILRNWIASGADWPAGRVLDPYEQTSDVRGGRDWWSLQPVVRPQLPTVQYSGESAATSQPIDTFILAGLQGATPPLTPAPAADRRTLLRRLYFDLIGLPPSAEQVDAFLADQSSDAYERVVDQLLASPQFGERWARHWLDVVRFAETNGYERDAVKPNAWKYRDWVIDAFNNDKPYDQFVVEQLAGDEIPDRTESSVIATGFIRVGTWDDEPNDPAEYQYERLEDMVHATTTAFLGLTVKCARCHDHKFDPILQTDYYRVAATFWPGPVNHRARELMGGPSAQELGFDVFGWTDIARDPPPLHLLKKGDIHRPGEAVAAGVLSAIPALQREFTPPPPSSATTQRRLQFARWIVDPRHPLTARVYVNRLWQHLMGEGLVRTPDNFGFMGDQPTHSELLDWLASEFVAGGWRTKPILRQIVLSNTYRQSSLHPEQATYAELDPGNQRWWRANRRRLEAESLRDAILVTSGQLDNRMHGPSFRAEISSEALEGLSMKGGAYQASPVAETNRRSIYMFTKRALVVPLMATFDACDTTLPNGRRDVTIVAPQALTLLNNDWIYRQSQHFAQAIMNATSKPDSSEPSARVDAVWRRALGRLPTDTERQAALAYIAQQLERTAETPTSSEEERELRVWTSLCHVLINTNEFIFID